MTPRTVLSIGFMSLVALVVSPSQSEAQGVCSAERAFYPDLDGDGFGDGSAAPVSACLLPFDHVENATDCDDSTAAANPGAPETCDSIDNNCDGHIDENVQQIAYRDADGDGYGSWDLTKAILACSPPSGYADNGTDCDDSIAGANRSAPEVCDTIDNDCDGQIDEDTQRVFFRDADGDGFGSQDPSDTMVVACNAPAGFTDSNSDCDDLDPTTHPGAVEVLDLANNDCIGVEDDGFVVGMEGPEGPPGLPGAQGPAGPAGATGATGEGLVSGSALLLFPDVTPPPGYTRVGTTQLVVSGAASPRVGLVLYRKD
ncbi:MAG TPA: putative metal-binding motif-containing protein [Polyangiaceae bacterium]|nr:putative metal-binding motif-containing protein [Polyangiaceae bacterium]